MNLGDAQPTAGVAKVLENEDDDAVDPHLKRIKNEAGEVESDQEDEDFVADKDDEGSPTGDSGAEDSDADEDGKKKKDPNAPNRALSGFMFFSQMERENLKKDIPGISFTNVGRVLGEKWKKMSAVEKEPYEAKAIADKQRYKDEISDYKTSQPINIDPKDNSDDA